MDVLAGLGVEVPPLVRVAFVAAAIAIVPALARGARVPECVGFIAAGVLVGPHLLGLVPSHAEVADFLAEAGKLLLMFFVGLEIDLKQFATERRRAAAFGLTTAALPLAAGTAVGLGFGYSPAAAVLIGSLLASHTLIAFPEVVRAGLAGRPVVSVTVGATVLTDMLSLLILAACLSVHRTGFDILALAGELAMVVGFTLLMLGVIGPAGRRLIARSGHSEEACFAWLLVIVCVGATLAEAIDLEGIIGAFLAGIAVNQAVRDLPAREKLEFVGGAVLIPLFFMVTGFLIDLVVLGRTLVQGLPMVLSVVLGLLASKWLAAELCGRAFGYDPADRRLMASLTYPQVAATLAAALVGFDAVNAAGERLLDEAMLNTVLVLVVVTSVLGPILTARAAAERPGGAALARPAASD